MSQTLQSLVDAACFLAGSDGLEKDVIGELLVPRVVYHVARRAARDEKRRALVTTTTSIALMNGNVALPATVLVEFMHLAAVENPADATMARKMRWIPSWAEFVRPLENTLGYFTVTQPSVVSQFYMTLPGASYAPGAGYTGSISLTVPQVPAIPSTPTGAFNVPGEIEDDVVLYLTAALKGDWLQLIQTENPKADQ